MRARIQSRLGFVTIIVVAGSVLADPNDWVNPAYALQSSQNAETSNARDTIIKGATSTSKKAPWTVSDSTSIRAPSNDAQDYLSWAPYHWPNCNWCPAKGGKTHLVTGSNSTDSDSGDESADAGPSDSDDTNDDTDDPDNGDEDSDSGDEAEGSDGALPGNVPAGRSNQRRMAKRFRRDFDGPSYSMDSKKDARPESLQAIVMPTSALPVAPYATMVPSVTLPPSLESSQGSQSTDRVISGTPEPAENGAKTQKGKGATPTAKCTPSPTKSLAPSATWTTCPYVTRDGKLNPDVRQLHGVNAVNGVTQSVLYNALAYAFTKSESYSKNAASFIDTFFLDSKAGINPELSYGQVIRGPGIQQGQYLGILDFRGMVKVVNAIQLLKAAGSPDWTSVRDNNMNSWAEKYMNWLQTSSQGKKGATAPNNHGTFYFNQFTALHLLSGDMSGASAAVTGYFKHQFLDQIAASGEQPFEAVRTRPFHYRCFNLEAMITNAKLGDQVGLNLWTAKSKYGSTIQTAVNFMMKLNPGKEDVTEILPHVAAAAAAYGDPDGKYAAFLEHTSTTYKNAPYYYYDQTAALTNSPAATATQGNKRDTTMASSSQEVSRGEPVSDRYAADTPETTTGTETKSADSPDVSTPSIPFVCPAVFANVLEVQLDDGVFVTCAQLKPFYGYLDDV